MPTVGIHVTAEERRALQAQADAAGLSLSAFLRNHILPNTVARKRGNPNFGKNTPYKRGRAKGRS